MVTRQQCEVTKLFPMNKIKLGGGGGGAKDEGEVKPGFESIMHHIGLVHRVTLNSVIQQSD